MVEASEEQIATLRQAPMPKAVRTTAGVVVGVLFGAFLLTNPREGPASPPVVRFAGGVVGPLALELVAKPGIYSPDRLRFLVCLRNYSRGAAHVAKSLQTITTLAADVRTEDGRPVNLDPESVCPAVGEGDFGFLQPGAVFQGNISWDAIGGPNAAAGSRLRVAFIQGRGAQVWADNVAGELFHSDMVSNAVLVDAGCGTVHVLGAWDDLHPEVPVPFAAPGCQFLKERRAVRRPGYTRIVPVLVVEREGRRTWLKQLADLRGRVRIRSAAEALAFVRLGTGPETHRLLVDSPYVEVQWRRAAPLEQLGALSQGWWEYLGLRSPRVMKRAGRWVVERCVATYGVGRLGLNRIYRLRETVAPDGRYSSQALALELDGEFNREPILCVPSY